MEEAQEMRDEACEVLRIILPPPPVDEDVTGTHKNTKEEQTAACLHTDTNSGANHVLALL